MPETTSGDETRRRFGTSAAAEKYARSLAGSATHRREVERIRQGLGDLPPGARILDLPCGTGRLLKELLEAGLAVTAADSSAHMVGRARTASAAGPVRHLVADVFALPFRTRAFDAVVCNRLIHHFREPDVRRRALAELARVTRGPVVVSFFCSRGVDGWWWRVRNALGSRKAVDRIPVGRDVLAADARAAGLRVERFLPTRPWISKQWYAVLRPDTPAG